jgi:hypothetical protein
MPVSPSSSSRVSFVSPLSGPSEVMLVSKLSISRKPFAEWVLANMPARRADPIVMETEQVFTSREEAEWAVFCRRWRLLTGESVNRPFRD